MTLTWTVRNVGGSPVTITGDSRGVSFTPTQLLPAPAATGSEVIDGPAADEAVTETVTVDAGGGQTAEAAATVTVPACTGPAAPPDISFTFTNDPSVPVAEVGETVGVLVLRARTPVTFRSRWCASSTTVTACSSCLTSQTIVEPGQTFCNTDLDLEVTYEVRPNDEGSTIVNNAVVTVRTVGPEPQAFQAADPAEVEVPGESVPATR